MNIPRVGVAVVLHHHIQPGILMGKRKGSHGAGTWAFPGGLLEYGEPVIECARREVLEETGLKLVGASSEEGPWIENVFVEEGKHYITLYIISRSISSIPVRMEPEKCEEWRWVSLNNLPHPLFPPAAKFLQQYQGFLKGVL